MSASKMFDEKERATRYNVLGIPTFVAFEDNKGHNLRTTVEDTGPEGLETVFRYIYKTGINRIDD